MTSNGSTRRIVPALRAEWPLILAVGLGVALRCWQITGQIVGDDEWHALHAMSRLGYAAVLSHFGEADYSIPLTLFDKLTAQTVGLTEMRMRAPMLCSGVAALILLPLLVRRYVGVPVSNAFAWLLAIAPLHVYFSRYARPYSITMLLATAADIAFFVWLSGGSRRWAWLYVAGAGIAPYFHLAVLPFVLTPIAFGAGFSRIGKGERPRALREVAAVGMLVAAVLALLLALPLVVDARSLDAKQGAGSLPDAALLGAGYLFAGAHSRGLMAVMVCLAAAGWGLLARRQTAFAIYLGCLTAGQAGAVAVTKPLGIEAPIILARYLLPLLPVMLLCAATAVVDVEARLGSIIRLHRRGACVTILVAVLLYDGPLPSTYRYPNNWTNHGLFQYAYEREPYAMIPGRVSPFYKELSRRPAGSLLIVEAPWYYPWHENPYPVYQAIHRQRMAVGFVHDDKVFHAGEVLANQNIHFRNAEHVGAMAALVSSGVTYVVFHHALLGEFVSIAPHPPVSDVEDWIRRYRATVGPAAYEDDDLVVFDISHWRNDQP